MDHVESEKIVAPDSRKHFVPRRDVLKNAVKLAAGSAVLALPMKVYAQSGGFHLRDMDQHDGDCSMESSTTAPRGLAMGHAQRADRRVKPESRDGGLRRVLQRAWMDLPSGSERDGSRRNFRRIIFAGEGCELHYLSHADWRKRFFARLVFLRRNSR